MTEASPRQDDGVLYHVEFKSRFDGRWLGARVGHSMTLFEAVDQITERKRLYPDTEYRIACGAFPQ